MPVAEKHHTDWNQARDWLLAAAWPTLLLFICIGFFWKLVLTDQYTWLDRPDIAYQLLPSYQFQAGEWHASQMPLWDLYRGQPLLGQAESGAAYPLNWLLFLAPLRDGWIRQAYLHWYFVLIHFQAALFCYWLCRDLNRSQAASLLSGLAFGLGGFMGANTWPPMLNGAVWAPLVFLFFLRAVRGQRPVASAAWSGAFLGIAFLSGNFQIPILICLAVIGAWLYLRHYYLKVLLIFLLFLFLVGAFTLLSAYKYETPATRLAGWNPVGLVMLALALTGVIGNWKNPLTRLFAGIALVGLMPSAILMFHFALCVLIAYGIDSYMLSQKPLKKALTILLCSISAGAALLIWILHTTKTSTDPRLGIVVLVGFFLASILNAWDCGRITERTALTALALVMIFELGNLTTYSDQAHAEVKSLLMNLKEHSDIAGFLSHQSGPVRVEVDAHDVPYNFGDWYGIDQLGDGLSTRVAMLDGTNFQVSRSPKRPDQVEVFAGRSGVKVYENRSALPRVSIVHEVVDAVQGVAPKLENCPGVETVSLVGRRSGRVALQADLKCRGMVIEADAFSPDWVATVDGKPSRLYSAYGFLRGVVVEAGSHRIEMRYRPKSVYWGVALSVLGLLGALALTVTSGRPRAALS
jgi:hypothetical protein